MMMLLAIKEDGVVVAWKRAEKGWTVHGGRFHQINAPILVDVMGDASDLRRVKLVTDALGIALEAYEPADGDLGGMEGFLSQRQLRTLRPFLAKIGLPFRRADDIFPDADAACS